MNFLNILLAISPALEAGKTLNNFSAWSNVANVTHALVIIFAFLLLIPRAFGYDIVISDDQLFKLAAAIAGVGGPIVAGLHVGLNPNIGITRK